MPNPNNSLLVRKLRKKLRQIENLSRCDRDLTHQEQLKVDSKDTLRAELQELLAEEEEEDKMVELAEDDDINNEEKLDETENVKDHHQTNGHHIKHLKDGLLGLNENGDIVLAEENGTSLQNGVSNRVEEEVENKSKSASENNEEVMEIETLEVDENKETEEIPRLRRSTRERKPRNVAKDTTADLFKDMNLKASELEGHHDDVCSVDMYHHLVVSGGRDTSLKLWDESSKEELLSLGGHEGTISCVRFLTDQAFENRPPVITASSDCSLRIWNIDEGKMTKSIYVYSPVTSLDYSQGLVAIGTEGGKLEVYGIENSDQQFTVNAYEDPVTSVKFLDTDRVACGSTNGIVKIFNIGSPDVKDPLFTLDPESIKVYNKHEAGSKPYGSQSSSILNMSKVTCMEVYNELILYGDAGYNIKVLDYQKGGLTKVRNNLKEFCPTEALHIAEVQSKHFLFSVGSDVDSGDAYINIRSLPELQYMGTIRDIESNSGSVISMALQEINNQIHFTTGGAQLRVWNQINRRGRKRKGSPNGDVAIVPCKYICNFTDPRDSEPESDNETETELESKSETSTERSTERIPAGSSNSWCNIL